MESNQSAARSARRFLDDRVRTDWDWPKPPDCWPSEDEVRGVSSFRERYYGDSSPDSTDDESEGDPYKFDSPDSIGQAVERKTQSRKRKRMAALEAEMKENEGLRIWVQRRDVWTGVAAARKHGTNPQPSATADTSSSNPSTPMDTDSSSPPPQEQPAAVEPLTPLALPLLPDNAIRKSITPKAYSDMFNKIVMSSRTPSVPINLCDMTGALVQGWKETGEWPPKAAPLDPLAGKKRVAMGINGTEPFLSHHPHLQKGMDSVKRIFHLNGHHQEGAFGVGNNG